MNKPRYCPGTGSPNAKLMIIAEAPGYEEDKKGEPLVGPSGQLAKELLELAGMSWGETYRTNVVKYRPPSNDLKRLSEYGLSIEDGIPQLWQEIQSINPNVILALGGTALEALCGVKGINKYRGSILRSLNYNVKVVPTLHPATLLPGPHSLPYSSRAFVQVDFIKAVRESRSKGYKPLDRSIIIARSSRDLLTYLRQNEDATEFASDIETYRSLPSCISFSAHKSHAISVPLMNMHGALDSIVISDHDRVEIWDLVSKVLESNTIGKVFQNGKFDIERIENTLRMDVNNFVADTMLMFSTCYPEFPKGLGFQTSILTDEPFYKDEGKEFNPSKHKFTQLLTYNGKDSCVTKEIKDKLDSELAEFGLKDFYYNYVHKLHDLYYNLEDIGFAWDQRRQDELKAYYNDKNETLQKELDQIVGHSINVNSGPQVSNLLYNELRFPERSGANEDTIIALIANHAKDDYDKRRTLELILDVRRVRKTISTYLSANTDYDGRMRTSYNIVGTETGRSSTSRLGPPRGPSRPTKIGLPFQTIPEHGDFGTEISDCFIADEGKTLLNVDLSQAEARVVALLARDYELLKNFDTIDIHKLTSSWLFSCSMDDITKDMRFIGKMARHGGNYDMGKRRLCMEINTNAKKFHIPVSVTEKKAGEIRDIFHKYTPNIKAVFHKEIKDIANGDRTLVNPYGRRRQFFDRWGEDLFKEMYAHLPQSTVKDHLSHAMLKILKREPEIQFLMEKHDSFVAQIPTDRLEITKLIIREEMEREIDFKECTLKRGKLSIPCDIKIGQNLGHMETVK